jgi:ABC-type antimicrobial peptide transport system permease subunit
MAYVVATRRRELGIRIALGAVRADVMRDVFRSSLTITALGLALGLGGALVAGRVMASQLFQVGRADPAVAAATVAVVAVVAALACYVPARRAAAVDPVTVLRSE